MASIEYIEAEALAEALAADPHSVTVVDVRDEDRGDNGIRGSIHFPSRSHSDAAWAALAGTITSPNVVFHCMFSQERGPRAARAFARYAPPHVQRILILRGGWVMWSSTVGKRLPALCIKSVE